MRILVIGGTEFIGPATVARLVDRGHDMWVLHRRAQHDLGPAVHNLQADRADLGTVERLLREHAFEAVIDLAYDWEKGTPAAQVEAAARACGTHLRRYVFMSSIAAYGGGLDRRESDPLAPDAASEPYVRHKAMAERALFRLRDEVGLPVVTVRPPFIHGPRQPFYREAFFWDRLLDGRPVILPDGGEAPMQWAYVGDVADTCVASVERREAEGEAFNIGHVAPVSQRAYVETLARVAGVRPRLAAVRRAEILAAGGHPFLGSLYFGEYLDIPPMTLVVEKVSRVLGVVPSGFEESLRHTYAWYRTRPRRPVDYSFEDRMLAQAT